MEETDTEGKYWYGTVLVPVYQYSYNSLSDVINLRSYLQQCVLQNCRNLPQLAQTAIQWVTLLWLCTSLRYIGPVEAEEPEEETAGFTLIKYMDRKVHNKFVWGVCEDIYKTNNSDILLKVDQPIPVVSDRICL